MVVCSSLRRAVTSAFIWRCRDGSSGKGYRLALNASQICTDSRKSQADSTLGASPLQQQHAAKGLQKLFRSHAWHSLTLRVQKIMDPQKECATFHMLGICAQKVRMQSRLCSLIGQAS